MQNNYPRNKSSRVYLYCSICLFIEQSGPNAQIYSDSSKKYQLFLWNHISCLPAWAVPLELAISRIHLSVFRQARFSVTWILAECCMLKYIMTSLHSLLILFYASLSQDASGKNGVLSGTANLKQFWWELEGLYRLNPWLEAGVGARINNITAGANINFIPPPPLTGSSSGSDQKSNTWVDPLIVTRLRTGLIINGFCN